MAQTPTDKRLWTSNDGRQIKAALVKLTPEGVVLRLDDGNETTVKQSSLSLADQAYLASRPATPTKPETVPTAAIFAAQRPKQYAFSVTWSKEKTFDIKSGTSVVSNTSTWQAKFRITNLLPRELTGLVIGYEVQLKRDRDAELNRYDYVLDAIPIASIKPNESIEISTKTFDIVDSKLVKGKKTKDGTRPNKSDTLIGVMLDIVHLGKLAHEYKSIDGVDNALTDYLKARGLIKP